MSCAVCHRDPDRMNSEVAECSHVDCPHRRHAWSERPTAERLYRGPWRIAANGDPLALDVDLARRAGGTA